MPAFMVTSPEGKKFRINAPEGATPDEALEYAKKQFASLPSNDLPVSRGRTALEQGLQGATFGFADELTDRLGAGIASVYTGEKYSDLLKEARANTKNRFEAQNEQNPGISLAANLGGALVSGGIGAGTKVGSSLANSLRTGGVGARIGKGAMAGAASGGLFGAGSAFEGDRIEGATEGALLGGAIGAALPAAGAALSPLTQKAADAITKKVAIASGELPETSLLPKALKKVSDRLRADFPDEEEFKQALNNYFSKKDKTLLETGRERTANLAEGAAMFPSGGARASEFFKEATSEAGERIKGVAAKAISPNSNYHDTLEEIVKKGRETAAPLYQKAFQKNQSIQSPVIDRILRTPEGKGALQEAVRNMRNEMSLVAKPDPELTQLMREMVDLGKMNYSVGGVARGLKLKTLDYIKKAMDSTINKAYRSGDEGEAARIINLKKGLVSEIDSLDKSGLYAKARATSGDYLSNKAAMEAGADFLKEDAEIVKRNFAEFGKAEKEAYKNGIVKAIRDNIDNKFDGRNTAQLFQKPSMREKLSSVLSPKEYSRLMDEVSATDNIYKLRNQITGNSRTQIRAIAVQEFDNEGQQLLEDIATRGATGTIFKRAMKFVGGKFNGMNDKLAGEVADILFETDPKKKYQIVKALVNDANARGQSLRSTEAAKKLAVFYKISDGLTQAKNAAVPVISNEVSK